jgi:drug/metabolite transporter (DMT)-like permease
LVLATEPAWALVAAILLAGQRFGVVEAIGAAIVLAAILGHEALALRPPGFGSRTGG